MDNNDLIKKRLTELYNRSYSRGYTLYSGFLNMDEQSILASLNLPCVTWGGYDMAERVTAGFGDYVQREDFPVVCLCVKPVMQRFADNLNHRDFLGAIMNLGIKRELIGDIIISSNCGYVFCLEQISEYITDNLKRIKHTTVEVSLADRLPDTALEPPEAKELIVASLRLDAIISAVYKLSRNEASRLFAVDKVFVNSRQCSNSSYTVKNGDIISVRGFGRFIFESQIRTTKKDRAVVCVRIYR
ncbi:MAG: RNA-binding protein [Eubacterium sp.]